MSVRVQTRARRFPIVRLTLSLFGLTAAPAASSADPALAEDSGGVVCLRSPDLRGLQSLIDGAAAQRASLAADLSAILAERERAWRILRRRQQFPLRLIPGPWGARARRAFTATEAEVLDIRATIARSRVRVAFAADPATLTAQQALSEAFAALGRAEQTWEVVASTPVAGERDRSAAAIGIERVRVPLTLGRDELVVGDRPPLRLRTVAGAHLDLYPGFAVLREHETAMRRLLDLRDIGIEVGAVDVLEEEAAPADARVVGHAWARANQDGSPDRRFKNNREIPRLRYGVMRITTPIGALADLQSSDCEAVSAFGAAFRQLRTAMVDMGRRPLPDEPPLPVAPVPLKSLPPLPPLPTIERAHEITVLAAGLALTAGLLSAAAILRHHARPPQAAIDPVHAAGAPITPQAPAATLAASSPPAVEGPAAGIATASIRKPAVRSGVVRRGGLLATAASLRRHATPPEASGGPIPVVGENRVAPSPPTPLPPIESPAPRRPVGSIRKPFARPRNGPAVPTFADGSGSQMTTLRPTRLRLCPSRACLDLSILARGTQLDVFGRRGLWVEVGQSQPWGWVSARSLVHVS